MMKFEIDNNNYVVFRLTPWDTKAFGFSTSEIMEIIFDSEVNLELVLNGFEGKMIELAISFTYTRINASESLLKKYIQKFGYYYVETSVLISLNNIKKQDFRSIYRNELELITPDDSDFISIKEIARNAFNYSRFHEDPYIDENKARERYFNWIDDLRVQNKSFLICKVRNEVVSFLAYDILNNNASLILAGSDINKGLMSPYFWSSFMTYLQKKDVKKVKTIISTSNIPIMNLYNKFNFVVEQTMLGFHKFR